MGARGHRSTCLGEAAGQKRRREMKGRGAVAQSAFSSPVPAKTNNDPREAPQHPAPIRACGQSGRVANPSRLYLRITLITRQRPQRPLRGSSKRRSPVAATAFTADWHEDEDEDDDKHAAAAAGQRSRSEVHGEHVNTKPSWAPLCAFFSTHSTHSTHSGALCAVCLLVRPRCIVVACASTSGPHFHEIGARQPRALAYRSCRASSKGQAAMCFKSPGLLLA